MMNGKTDWKPTADLETLQQRARLYQTIRQFMFDREYMEVDTPILSRTGISDPYIHTVAVNTRCYSFPLYLHTSPEYCMKRLLAAGSGSIYQITHAFRDEEQGRQHLTEFSMLEWYRLGADYHSLMSEVSELLESVSLPVPLKMTYAEAFQQSLGIDPHSCDIDTLNQIAQRQGLNRPLSDKPPLLDFLFSSCVINDLDTNRALFIYDYPKEMAALATIKQADNTIAERFELFIDGMEIANGFNELTDADEQRERFMQDLSIRKKNQDKILPIDERLLDALEAGLPVCSGVAIGLDRLLMVLMHKSHINQIATFAL